jgi:hypothetical protein
VDGGSAQEGIGAAWRRAVAVPRLRALAIAAPVVLVGELLCLRRFLDVIEARRGVAFVDPLLSTFAPHDLAALLFPLMYVALLGVLVALVRYPERLIAGVWAYVLMIAARMVVMYLLPLDPPRRWWR